MKYDTCPTCHGHGVVPRSALFESALPIEVPVRYESAGAFDDFWRDYPRKQAKATAVKSWNRMTHTERVAAIDVLPDHLAMWDREGRGTRLVPMATTWLNQRRWEDDLSEYVDDRVAHKPMPGRTGIEAAMANRRGAILKGVADGGQREIEAGS